MCGKNMRSEDTYKKRGMIAIAVFLILINVPKYTGADSFSITNEPGIAICANDNILVGLGGGYLVFRSDEGTWSEINKELKTNLFFIGTDNRVYASKTILDCNGDINGNYQYKSVLEYGVIVDENGSYLFELDHPSGISDGQNNLHFIMINSNDNTTFYRKLSSDGTVIVNKTILNHAVYMPKLDFDSNGNLHVTDMRNQIVYYMKLDNNGTILFNETDISNNVRGWMGIDLIIDKLNNAHIIYSGSLQESRFALFHVKIAADGNIVKDNGVITQSEWNINSKYPSMALDSENNIHVVWYGIKEGENIFYMKLDDDSNLISGPINLTMENEYPTFPLTIALILITIVIILIMLIRKVYKRKKQERSPNHNTTDEINPRNEMS
jgi:hypothetical protein